jgi:hypothetical protein
MSDESKPVHPSAAEVAEDGVEVVRDVGTDARGIVVPRAFSEPSKIGEKKEGDKKEDKAA